MSRTLKPIGTILIVRTKLPEESGIKLMTGSTARTDVITEGVIEVVGESVKSKLLVVGATVRFVPATYKRVNEDKKDLIMIEEQLIVGVFLDD